MPTGTATPPPCHVTDSAEHPWPRPSPAPAPPLPPPTPVGAELAAMHGVIAAVAGLDAAARLRVAEWLTSRLTLDLARVTASVEVVAAARVYRHSGGTVRHWPAQTPGTSACGRHLDPGTAAHPARTPTQRRCRAGSCPTQWRNYDSHAALAGLPDHFADDTTPRW